MMGQDLITQQSLSKDILFLIEISFILSAFILAKIAKRYLNKRILRHSDEIANVRQLSTKRKLIHNYDYISLPLYLTLILAIFYTTSYAWSLNTKILLSLTQFNIVWFCLRFITIISGSKSPRLIVIILATILLLDISGLTEVVNTSLDRISIELGQFRLSALLIIKTIITLIISLWVINLVSKISRKIVSNFKGLNISAKNITTTIIDITLYFFLFLTLLKIVGFDITTVAVIGSAVGIGIGFGLQKITSNFISGLILLFEKSIKEGDVVELSNNPGDIGFVKRMGIRYTLIRTFDNKEIMMPNEDFITNKVTNWTFSDKEVRIRVDVGVSYESDINLVKKIILEVAEEHMEKDITTPPICYLNEFADSSVNFILYMWTNDVSLVQHAKKSDVLFSIWHKFKEHGIVIPFPQRDVHIKGGFKSQSS